MKKDEVKVGQVYTAKVSNRVVQVRIDGTHSRQGWNATNTATGKRVHIKSAQRLRSAVKAKSATAADIPTKTACAAGEVAKAEHAAAKAGKIVKAATKTDVKPKRVSALDAAATVLQKAGAPMKSQEMIAAMAEQGLWQSPNGKTPHATLYAAVLREIKAKGDAARFRKVDRGQFAYAG